MHKPARFHRRASLGLLLGLLSAGCGVETVVHQVNEKEANQIIEVLANHGITAEKLRVDTGRDVYYHMQVPASVRLDAVRVLNQYELPRRRDKGYGEVFAAGGLIPTSSEEKAKRLTAIEGEIERQLKLIEAVLDAQVQIVLPEDSPLRTTQEAAVPTTAAVTIKYLPDSQSRPPISEPEVAQLVASGVEKLTKDNVFVLMRPATLSAYVKGNKVAESSAASTFSDKRVRLVLIGMVAVVLLLGMGLVFQSTRLTSVRGRLMRLQNEIAKARRKPGDSQPSGLVAP